MSLQCRHFTFHCPTFNAKESAWMSSEIDFKVQWVELLWSAVEAPLLLSLAFMSLDTFCDWKASCCTFTVFGILLVFGRSSSTFTFQNMSLCPWLLSLDDPVNNRIIILCSPEIMWLSSLTGRGWCAHLWVFSSESRGFLILNMKDDDDGNTFQWQVEPKKDRLGG